MHRGIIAYARGMGFATGVKRGMNGSEKHAFNHFMSGLSNFLSELLQAVDAQIETKKKKSSPAYQLIKQEKETLFQISETLKILENTKTYEKDEKVKHDIEQQQKLFHENQEATELALQHAYLNYAVMQHNLPAHILRIKQEADGLKIKVADERGYEWVKQYLLKVREYERALESHIKKGQVAQNARESKLGPSA